MFSLSQIPFFLVVLLGAKGGTMVAGREDSRGVVVELAAMGWVAWGGRRKEGKR